MEIKLTSWNVNGIRAASGKEGWEDFWACGTDIVGLQETKALPEQIPDKVKNRDGMQSWWCSSTVKKGYSGVGVFSRISPMNVSFELPVEEFQGEGRLLRLEFEKFHFVATYVPNGGEEVLSPEKKHVGNFKRLPYKMGYLKALLAYLEDLRKSKPVVVCGDFNIAHKAVDLARPDSNVLSTGFLPIEREFLDLFCQHGYIDTFRKVHPDQKDAYSWWSYRMAARAKNVGWRIDYFFVSKELEPNIKDAWIMSEQQGSDHCPVGLSLAW